VVKSFKFRVTMVMPCTKAVAAIRPSRTGLGLGTCKAAARLATGKSIESIRSLKAFRT